MGAAVEPGNDCAGGVGHSLGRAIVVIGPCFRVGSERSVRCLTSVLMSPICRYDRIPNAESRFAVWFGHRPLKPDRRIENSVQTAASHVEEASLPTRGHPQLKLIAVVFAVGALVMIDLAVDKAVGRK